MAKKMEGYYTSVLFRRIIVISIRTCSSEICCTIFISFLIWMNRSLNIFWMLFIMASGVKLHLILRTIRLSVLYGFEYLYCLYLKNIDLNLLGTVNEEKKSQKNFYLTEITAFALAWLTTGLVIYIHVIQCISLSLF